ncbi:MAG: c-type cytochrome, partial [Verrucomicrobiales bacterium]|nr:c-type cytochrome [Verrucomicrobiales bacterium]
GYVSDWSDTGECHSTRNTRKSTGRIYKIVYGEPEMPELDLAAKSSSDLAKLALSDNRFVERNARRILWERGAQGKNEPTGSVRQTNPVDSLRAAFAAGKTDAEKLKALWALRCVGGLDDEFLAALLEDKRETVRAWAIRLLLEKNDRSPLNEGRLNIQIREKLLTIAEKEKSPRVMLHLISGAMRMPVEDRWEILESIAWREPFEDDPNLSLMLWYAIEDLFEFSPRAFCELTISRDPIIQRFVARRVASDPKARAEFLGDLFTNMPGHGGQLPVYQGIREGLEGVRSLKPPENWEFVKLQTGTEHGLGVYPETMKLGLLFDDPDAVEYFEQVASEPKKPGVVSDDISRKEAIEMLLQKRPPGLDAVLLKLVGDEEVQATAIRGLANFENPDIPAKILAVYPKLDAEEKQDALQTLAARPKWAGKLLDAVKAGDIPRTDMTAFTARQIVNLGEKTLAKRVTEIWGELKSSSAEKEKEMAAWRKKLTPQSIEKSDPKAGKAHFQKACAACHKLFGEGNVVGPELTGSQRNNIDYLLENLIDPSASVSKDFQMQIIETKDGRVVSGFAESENETAVTLRSINERVVIPLNEIETRTVSGVSLMPEGLLKMFSTAEVRELVAYLASPRAVNQ